MRGLEEYAFFTEVRSKWTIGNRYLYYIANEEKKPLFPAFATSCRTGVLEEKRRIVVYLATIRK